MREAILFAAALFAATSAMQASAQAPAGRAVSYDRLDLATRAGQAILNHRVATAIEAVCGSYAGASSDEAREIDHCRAAARIGIETQLAALRSRRTSIVLGSR